MDRINIMDIFSLIYAEFIPGFVKPLSDFYKYIMETKSDPRTKDWFLMNSPGPLLTIIATYLYFCLWAGPRFMKDRKPYKLKQLLRVYNFCQVIVNIHILREHIYGGWGINYSWACQAVDFSETPMAIRMASSVWWYFISKVTEILDTVFFILKKKNNQVSFVHLYHHSMMPTCTWVLTKFLPGGHGTLLGLINALVHIIMYSYYFITSLGGRFQKYLLWRRHLTKILMIQFYILFLHNFQALYQRCGFPKVMNLLLLIHTGLLLFLLGRFYLKTYILNNRSTPIVHINMPNGHLKED